MKNKNNKNSWLSEFSKSYSESDDFRKYANSLFIVLIFIIFSITMLVTVHNYSVEKRNNKTNTTTISTYQYKDILESILDNQKYTETINIDNNKSIIDGLYGNKILTGTLENINGTYKFIYKNDKVYEVRLDQELESTIFDNYNIKFIDLSKLVFILESNNSIKTINNNITKYSYSNINIDNDIYNIEVLVKDNKVTNINISNTNSSYLLEFNN